MKLGFFGVLVAGVLLISGCCSSCEKDDLGDYLLKEFSRSWTSYTIAATRVYSGSSGQEEVFVWEPVESGLEEQLYNCEDKNRCGFCCETFRSGYLYTQLVSSSGVFVFNLVVKKDFVQFTPDDNPLDISDMIVVSFNNRLVCDITGIPDTLLTQSVTLNGKTFSKVFTCRADPGSYTAGSSDPVAFYFTKEDGIVGYELANNTIWNLK
ncbi:MAG: hypothetical protein SF052_13975 [Bacteroidia bacterium]|nr:hypothetical protein [Bacteroidia bacterium]